MVLSIYKKFSDLKIDFSNKIVFLDIDGTITADNSFTFKPEVLEKIKELVALNKVYLCTNSRNTKRNQKISSQLNISLITQKHKKPSSKVIKGLDAQNKELAVIGDKFITDYLFAKNIAAKFYRVQRIISGEERLVIRLSYWLDNLLFLAFKYFIDWY